MNETVIGIANLAKWATILGASPFVVRGLWRAGLSVYDSVYQRVRTWRHDRLTLQHIGDQNALRKIRAIEANDAGRYPLLVGTDGTIRNPNTLAQFTISTVIERFPYLENIDARVRSLEAAGGWPTPAAAQAMLPEQSTPAGLWPSIVTMEQVFAGRRPTIDDLVVGVRPGANGLELVSDSIHNLMHTLTVGASGWGKSAWLRAFLWQIAKAREPVEIVAIDINGSEFNILKDWGKLRFPVARTTENAVAVLSAVVDEIKRRAAMYEQYPLVTNLAEYNKAAGADVPPWVIVFDEGTNALHKAGIGDPLRELVQTARQYGIYVILAGQTAKATVIDTEIRDQFSTRLCFRTSPTSSRVVLDDRAANDLHDKGRAIVQMVGREPGEIQAPWVTREQFMDALTGGGPQMATPENLPPAAKTPKLDKLTDDQVDDILTMHRAGESKRAIQRAIFGYEGGAAYAQVNAVLRESGTTDTGTLETDETAQ